MKPPTERQLMKWWDARIAAYRAEQGVESPVLTCADCGRRAALPAMLTEPGPDEEVMYREETERLATELNEEINGEEVPAT